MGICSDHILSTKPNKIINWSYNLQSHAVFNAYDTPSVHILREQLHFQMEIEPQNETVVMELETGCSIAS